YPPPDEAAMRKGEVQDKKQDKKQKEASGSLRPKGLRRMFRKASSSMLDIDTSVQKDFAGVSPASSTSGGSDGARDRAEIMRRRQGYLGAYPRKNSAGSSV
ncbi:hypothetical protein PUNSTDRAFT_52491, partial [Punctularia strigosozonata HHB-11173 SS5]|uniref:uncharacterized protein n=1 Tax=Punctularia strigosozonata (strain HHB-11173) TaxID=741275 RepID=UPI000441670D